MPTGNYDTNPFPRNTDQEKDHTQGASTPQSVKAAKATKHAATGSDGKKGAPRQIPTSS